MGGLLPPSLAHTAPARVCEVNGPLRPSSLVVRISLWLSDLALVRRYPVRARRGAPMRYKLIWRVDDGFPASPEAFDGDEGAKARPHSALLRPAKPGEQRFEFRPRGRVTCGHRT